MAFQKIIHGDCTAFLDLSDYDVLICDPPYSKHVHDKAMSQSASRGTRKRELGFDSLSEDLRWFICKVAANKIRRWSLIYSDIEGLGPWREKMISAGAEYIRHIPWIRWSAPQLSGDRPPSGCEFVTAYHNPLTKKQWNGPGNLLSLNHKCLRGENKHKAEKPLDQALDLVYWFSNPGEHVLDLTAGNGSVGLACKMLGGRSYTGYEIDKEWADKASSRLEGLLSDRDKERYERWESSHAIELEERRRMQEHTASVRAKFEAKKLYGDVR